RNGAGGEIVAILLVILIATRVFAEDEIIAFARLVTRAPDAVFEESQLRPRPTRKFHHVDLVGVRKACNDQHLAPGWMPARESRHTKLGIAPDFVRQLHRYFRNALNNEIVPGNKVIGLAGQN